jgi:hypothetical protein
VVVVGVPVATQVTVAMVAPEFRQVVVVAQQDQAAVAEAEALAVVVTTEQVVAELELTVEVQTVWQAPLAAVVMVPVAETDPVHQTLLEESMLAEVPMVVAHLAGTIPEL